MTGKDFVRQQTLTDYREVLSTDAGRRVFGGIFHACGLNAVGFQTDAATAAYMKGMHDAALRIANTIREFDSREIGECEAAYREFLERSKEDGDREDKEF